MTKVKCHQSNCINNVQEICSLAAISISFDCDNYKDINDTPEYQIPYFMRVKNLKTGREEKRASKGKKIELMGIVFYTNDNTRCNENWWLTEERSGYGVNKKKMLEHIEETKRISSEVIPVNELPTEGERYE